MTPEELRAEWLLDGGCQSTFEEWLAEQLISARLGETTRDCCGHLGRYHDDIADGIHACVQCAGLAARDRLAKATKR